MVSKVGCSYYHDELLLSSDTHFDLALEIAVLKHGAAWTLKGVPIQKPKRGIIDFDQESGELSFISLDVVLPIINM